MGRPLKVIVHNFVENYFIGMKALCIFGKLNLEYDRTLFCLNQPIGSARAGVKVSIVFRRYNFYVSTTHSFRYRRGVGGTILISQSRYHDLFS